MTRLAGEQLASFGEMKDDGSTDGCQWIYTGVYGPKGNFAQRRDNDDPSGLGVYGELGLRLAGEPAHPLQPRLRRPAGQALERGEGLRLLGRRRSGPAPDVPDFVATNAPSNGSGPFIMNPEGVSRLWART